MTDDTRPPDTTARGATHDSTHDAAPPAPDEPFTPPWVCTATSPLAATLDAHADAPVRPVALWPSGQHSDAAQRAGRDALGIDNDRRWAAAARANLAYAHEHGATGAWKVMRADARFLPDVPRRKRGSVDLLIATPPARLTPIRPGTNPRSNQELIDRLDSDLITTLDACRPLLRPGGTVVIVTRLIRRAGQLIDLTYPTDLAATWAGLQLVERIAALRVPIRDGHPRPPAPRRPDRRRRQRRRPGPPIVHDDVLVYQVPTRWQQWRLGR